MPDYTRHIKQNFRTELSRNMLHQPHVHLPTFKNTEILSTALSCGKFFPPELPLTTTPLADRPIAQGVD
jgi:hypothetical protein